MDERDRQWRGRDWRRSEDARKAEGGYRGREDRSFGEEQEFGAQRSGPDRDRVFGERDTGAGYNRGPGLGGYQDYRNADYDRQPGRPAWQDRDYTGVSPAMEQGEYELENRRREHGRNPRSGQPRFESQDYTAQDYSGGGRYYGDDARARIYREEYGQGGVEYGREPRGYDAGRSYGGSYGGAGSDYGYRARPAYGGTASGGTGGYDYERGYGDGGRRDFRGHAEEGGATDFLYRAGRKVREWFRGEDLMRDSSPDERGYRAQDRSYLADRDHRGRGPKGYKRSDERIGDEVNERLTDDSWLDASDIDVRVENGEVTLTGTVESREAKHRAERIAEDVSGVAHVQNNLRVGAGNPITGSGRGFGDSAVEAQARRDDPTANGSGGAAGTTPGGNGLSSDDDRL
jgi:osmotically-inducible protein OsmY